MDHERDGTFEVVWPLGRQATTDVFCSERVADLNGKTVAELEHVEANWFPVIRAALKRRFPDIKIVECNVFGTTHGADERKTIANLAENLRAHKIDAAISGIGV